MLMFSNLVALFYHILISITMLNVKEVTSQKNVPIWVQNPYTNSVFNVEPLFRVMDENGFLQIPSEAAKEMNQVIIALTLSTYCPEPVLKAICHITLIRMLLESIEAR